jgi:hypothetical protein
MSPFWLFPFGWNVGVLGFRTSDILCHVVVCSILNQITTWEKTESTFPFLLFDLQSGIRSVVSNFCFFPPFFFRLDFIPISCAMTRTRYFAFCYLTFFHMHFFPHAVISPRLLNTIPQFFHSWTVALTVILHTILRAYLFISRWRHDMVMSLSGLPVNF